MRDMTQTRIGRVVVTVFGAATLIAGCAMDGPGGTVPVVGDPAGEPVAAGPGGEESSPEVALEPNPRPATPESESTAGVLPQEEAPPETPEVVDPLGEEVPPEEVPPTERPEEPTVEEPEVEEPVEPAPTVGSGWTAASAPDLGLLHDVWVGDDDIAWIVGDDGRVSTGGVETPIAPSPGAQAAGPLYSVYGRGADVVAVGAAGAIHRRTAGAWVIDENTQSTADLFGVWMSPEVESYKGVAVGADGAILISSWEGEWWPMYAFTDEGDLTGDLYDVWGADNWGIWAVGADGIIMQYNGKHWGWVDSGTDSDLVGIAGSSSGQIFAVGADGSIVLKNGEAWSVYSSGLQPGVNALWVTGWGTPWFAGDDGAMFKLAGKAWSWNTVDSGTGEHLYGVHGGGETLWVVGDNGLIHHRPLGY